MRSSTLTFFAAKVVVFTTLLNSLCGEEAKTPSMQKLPSACEGNYFFEADFLYWKARQQGLDVFSSTSKSDAITLVDSDTEAVEVNTDKRQYHRLHFDWEPGFRLGMGYDFHNCQWALAGFWTYLHGEGQASHSHANIHWSASYNVLDVVVTGPPFRLGSSFTWKAFGGIKAAKIDQHLHASSRSSRIAENPFEDQNLTTSVTDSRSISRIDFKGIGPEVGVKTAWGLGKRWSIYANADGALLYSHYDGTFSDNLNDTTTFFSIVDPAATDEFIARERTKAATNTCQVVVDLGLGLRWQRYACLCHHSVGWVFQLGWEHTQWFDFNAIGRGDDLCLDGLVLSGQLQF